MAVIDKSKPKCKKKKLDARQVYVVNLTEIHSAEVSKKDPMMIMFRDVRKNFQLI